jgi:hypothetical protein
MSQINSFKSRPAIFLFITDINRQWRAEEWLNILSCCNLYPEKLIAPIFSDNMVDQEVIETEPTSFRCTVHGKPLPRIKW